MVMKKQSVKENYAYNTIFQIAILLVPFVSTPYVARVLGADGVGQYSMAFSVVTYFTLFANLGTAIYGKRTIAFVRDNPNELSDVFWNIFSFRLLSTLLCSVIYYGFLLFTKKDSLLGIIVGLNIINVATDTSWFFSGLEQFKIISIRNLIVRILNLIFIFIFVRDKDDVWKYALLLVGFTILGSLSLVLNLKPYIRKPRKIRPFNGFKDILQIFLPTIAAEIYMVLDKTMIGWITKSDYANGCYEQSEKIARVALTVVTSIGAVVLPRVANLFNNKSEEEAKGYVYKSYRLTWMLSIPMMFGLSAIAPILVPVFLGSGYNDSIPLLIIFSALIPFVGIAYTTGHTYLMATKQQNVYTISICIAAGINLLLNAILIPKLGAIGAAIASISVEGLGAFIQVFYCIKTGQLIGKKIFEGLWKYIVSGLSMFIIISFLRRFFLVNVFSLVILIFLGLIIYPIILLLLNERFFIDNVSMIFINIKRRLRRQKKE